MVLSLGPWSWFFILPGSHTAMPLHGKAIHSFSSFGYPPAHMLSKKDFLVTSPKTGAFLYQKTSTLSFTVLITLKCICLVVYFLYVMLKYNLPKCGDQISLHYGSILRCGKCLTHNRHSENICLDTPNEDFSTDIGSTWDP